MILKLIFAAAIFAFITPVVQASQEKALERQYKKELKKPTEKHSVETLRWVGGGLLNGYIFTDSPNGIRYFVSVKKDPAKAAEYFQAAASRSDRISQSILGIMYRQGNGVPKDLNRSIDLLSSAKYGLYDAETEYGLAIHESLRTQGTSAEQIKGRVLEMIGSLTIGERANYLPALNALSQIYEEGTYVERDSLRAASLRDRAEAIAREKIAMTDTIAAAQRRMQQYQKLATASQWKFDALVFLATIGIVGATSLSNYNSTCSVGCSPPSVVDLMNWGVL